MRRSVGWPLAPALLLLAAALAAASPPPTLIEVPADAVGSVPSNLTVSGDHLYFTADDGLTGRELWRLDADGTVGLVADLNPGPEGSDPRLLFDADGTLYFVAKLRLGLDSLEFLYGIADDGAVVPLSKSLSRFEAYRAVGRDGRMLVTASTPETGRELWVADANAGTLELLHDISPGPESSLGTHGYPLGRFRDHRYIPTLVSPGSPLGAVWHLPPGDDTPRLLPLLDGAPRPIGAASVFTSGDLGLLFASGDQHVEIWRIDPQSGGARHAATLPGGPSYLVLEAAFAGTRCIFNYYTDEHGAEPWVYDDSGLRLLNDIHPGPASSGAHKMTSMGDWVAFAADDGAHGSELWRTDGTPEGTYLLKDLIPGPVRSEPYSLYPYRGKLLFSGYHNDVGEELWITDGTPEGTRLLADIHPGPGNAEPYYLTEFQGRVYFCANAPERGFELWSTDGTPEGTAIAASLKPRVRMVLGSHPRELTAVGDRLFFSAEAEANKRTLWTADGNAVGATDLTHLFPEGLRHDPRELRADGKDLYLRTGAQDEASPVWRIGPEMDRAIPVDDFPPSTPPWEGCLDLTAFEARFPGSPPPTGARAGDHFFFSASTDELGAELWVADCADGQPRLVRDILPGVASSAPSELFSYGKHVLFRAYDVNYGAELWGSDGTAAGTIRLTNLLPTPRGTVPTDFHRWQDSLVYISRNVYEEVAILRRMLRPEDLGMGANRLFQIQLHSGPERILDLCVAGDHYYFVSDHPATGEELFMGNLRRNSLPRVLNLRADPAYDPVGRVWWPGPTPPTATEHTR